MRKRNLHSFPDNTARLSHLLVSRTIYPEQVAPIPVFVHTRLKFLEKKLNFVKNSEENNKKRFILILPSTEFLLSLKNFLLPGQNRNMVLHSHFKFEPNCKKRLVNKKIQESQ